MFNVNSFVRKATKSEQVKSMTMRELITAFVEAGKNFTGKKFVHSKNLDRDGNEKDYLLLGTFDNEGSSIEGTDLVTFSVSNKLKLKGVTADAKFAELFENYPVFYGENAVKEGGIPTGEIRPWLTIAPVGSLESTPASPLDIKALVQGKSITTAVAGAPNTIPAPAVLEPADEIPF